MRLQQWPKQKEQFVEISNMAEQSLDTQRITRDQQSRISAAAVLGLNAARPFLQYQPSMLRLMASNFELMARNYERLMEALTTTVEQQHQQTREAAE
jgi:hypothetical protein